MRTYCNPLNLPYQYQHYGKGAHREAADPTMILFKGRYYIFASMSGGFYWSDDLLNWNYHQNPNLDLYRYAPDVREVNGHLVFCASRRNAPSTFWVTDDPFAEHYEKVSDPFDFWDPATFQDDDGRVYFYWGCESGRPIYGIELDSKTLTPIGDKKELIFGQKDAHGWERKTYPGAQKEKLSLGMELLYFMMKLSGHGSKDDPFIEGAYMNKWNGKYYLQYAAPATEISTYGDGAYISDSPLGPFTYQVHNPISLKPGGFITGAGHGSTIEDKYGNLWHAASMRISINANFERRLGLFPAGLDQDGVLFCNQNFADYPLEIPQGKFDPLSIKPKWMLLSYKKKVRASSCEENYPVENVCNEDIRNSWCAKGSSGEWIEMDLGRECTTCAVQVNLADVAVPVVKMPNSQRSDVTTNRRWIDLDKNRRVRWLLEGSVDGATWRVAVDKQNVDTDLANDYIELEAPMNLRYLRLTAVQLPYGQKFAVSGLRVFGIASNNPPAKVTAFTSTAVDEMTSLVQWPEVPGAVGYNVRYGIAPDKLYLSYLVYDCSQVMLTALNKDQRYYACVDAFNEGGITEGATGALNK